MLKVRSILRKSATGRILRQSIPARQGFSLIEMLVVLGILILMTAVSIPGIQRLQRGIELDRAVSLLQTELQETRIEAIRSGEPWMLQLPSDRTAGRRRAATISDADNTNTLAAGKTFAWPEGIRCEWLSRSTATNGLACHADGTVTEATLCLVDKHGGQTIVQIDRLTGTVRVLPVAAARLSPSITGGRRS